MSLVFGNGSRTVPLEQTPQVGPVIRQPLPANVHGLRYVPDPVASRPANNSFVITAANPGNAADPPVIRKPGASRNPPASSSGPASAFTMPQRLIREQPLKPTVLEDDPQAQRVRLQQQLDSITQNARDQFRRLTPEDMAQQKQLGTDLARIPGLVRERDAQRRQDEEERQRQESIRLQKEQQAREAEFARIQQEMDPRELAAFTAQIKAQREAEARQNNMQTLLGVFQNDPSYLDRTIRSLQNSGLPRGEYDEIAKRYT